MYYHGQFFSKDYAQARYWFAKAAGQGDMQAQFNMGWMCQESQGGPQDLTQARLWYGLADGGGAGPSA